LRYHEEEIVTRKSALSTSERDEWEKKNLIIRRSRIPNKLSFRNPLKAVRKSKRKKAARQVSDVFFFRRFLLLRRQKKSAKPGKGCETPFDIIA